MHDPGGATVVKLSSIRRIQYYPISQEFFHAAVAKGNLVRIAQGRPGQGFVPCAWSLLCKSLP